jgi:Mu-like prophage major head subunit gpT
MSVITTGNNPKLLWPGLNAVWGRDYKEHAREYTDLFDVFTSDKNYEEDVEATGFGLAPIATEGGSTTYDTESQQTVTRYTHVEYKLGFIVTRAERDDNLYEKKGVSRTQALAFSFRQTEENVAANVYNRAQTAGYTYGDGQVLSSVSHPTLAGNQSNRLTTAADLSEASLEDLCIQIMNAQNSRGLRIGLMPKKLIIPPALAFEAARILKSVNQSGTANNDVNALKVMGSIPEMAVNHYLTDTDAFFIRTNAPQGMKFFRRVATEFAQDGDFDSDNIKYRGYMRFSVGASDFRGLYTNGMGA